jgi:predicted phage-related endonuclease
VPALTQANQLIRAVNVTASEVAALMGDHPYLTAGDVYDRLTGATGPVVQNEAMQLGSFFEDRILRFAEQRDGFRARLNARTYQHPTVRLAATPDAYMIRPPDWILLPERALVEVKMSGKQWNGDCPVHVEWQARAQMAVTGFDAVWVYALAGMKLSRFYIARGLALEARLLDTVSAFWSDHVNLGIRPEPAVPATITYQDAKV